MTEHFEDLRRDHSGGGDSAVSPLREEFHQLTRAAFTTDSANHKPEETPEPGASPGSGNFDEVADAKKRYPILSPHIDSYLAMAATNDPAAFLKAEPDFRQAVKDSDDSFNELEGTVKKELEAMGPDLPQFKRDFLSADRAFNEQWEKLSESQKLEIAEKMTRQGVPLSRAARDYPELSEAALQKETIFQDNLEQILRLSQVQSKLLDSYQQRVFARDMHGDSLLYGSQALPEGAERRRMLDSKAALDSENARLRDSGAPNVFDYILDGRQPN